MNLSLRVNAPRLGAASPAREPSLGRTLALLALVFAVALFYAFASVKALHISYQVSRELETQKKLREAGRRLRVELNILKAPERLERQGRRLGLAPPRPGQVRVLP